ERPPDERSRDERRLGVRRPQRLPGIAARVEAGPIRPHPPPVAAQIDEHPHEPSLFVWHPLRHPPPPAPGPPEPLLPQTARIVGALGQRPGQAKQSVVVRVEQAGQPGRLVPPGRRWDGHGYGITRHHERRRLTGLKCWTRTLQNPPSTLHDRSPAPCTF